MKVLLIGLGQLGLGLIVPIFKKAGYTVTGTDADPKRLRELRNGYILKTPDAHSAMSVEVTSMKKTGICYDLVVTSVGRTNIEKVASWYREKKLSAPVLLAENLFGSVTLFPRQIPMVVDRICPRIKKHGSILVAIAENYYRIVVLDTPLTRQLSTVDGIKLAKSKTDIERERKQKLFTVNTAHVLTALYGHKAGCITIDEAITNPRVASKVYSALLEICPWLGINNAQAEKIARAIIQRFSSPIHDPLARLVGPAKKESALRYIETPLASIRSMGLKAPILEEARKIISA